MFKESTQTRPKKLNDSKKYTGHINKAAVAKILAAVLRANCRGELEI